MPEFENCDHPDGVYLYDASDEEGHELAVFRCTVCNRKYVEGR